jgi:F0F1-type ATP synthase delta subunit
MMEQAYAQALWDLIQKGEKPKEAVTKIHRVLESKGRAALMPAVGRAFERLAQREAQKNRSVLVVARKSDEAKARRESDAKEAELSVDESIIGGWQLFDRGVLRDESWKSALLSIYNAATN